MHHHRSNVQYKYSPVSSPSPEAEATISNSRPRLFEDDVAALSRCVVDGYASDEQNRGAGVAQIVKADRASAKCRLYFRPVLADPRCIEHFASSTSEDKALGLVAC
jgi:hypothetical protein